MALLAAFLLWREGARDILVKRQQGGARPSVFRFFVMARGRAGHFGEKRKTGGSGRQKFFFVARGRAGHFSFKKFCPPFAVVFFKHFVPSGTKKRSSTCCLFLSTKNSRVARGRAGHFGSEKKTSHHMQEPHTSWFFFARFWLIKIGNCVPPRKRQKIDTHPTTNPRWFALGGGWLGFHRFPRGNFPRARGGFLMDNVRGWGNVR